MNLAKSFSGKIIILLMLLFSINTYNRIEKTLNTDKDCLCVYDGFGYYMYLPQLFQEGNLLMNKEWAQGMQDQYCYGTPINQLEKAKNTDNYVDIYHMGLSILHLPSYTIANLFASGLGYKTDGFSTPYRIAFYLNALLFIFLGLLYLRKLLLLFVREKETAILLIIAYLATNAYLTFTLQFDLPHLYLFTLNTISVYHLMKYRKSDTRRSLMYSALIFGLTVCIRPTQVLFGIIPFFLLLKKEKNFKQFVFRISWYPIFAFLWNIPQILYWHFVAGEWLVPNLHTEDIVLIDPNIIDFLFSYRKGWLLYTPIFLLLPYALYKLYKNDKRLFWAISVFAIVYIYIMASWECWWYASSFSSRVMVDIYPVLIIPFAIAIANLRGKTIKVALGIFAFLCLILNQFQMYQFKNGIMHHDRMSKEHYWYIFGKPAIQDFHRDFLIIHGGDKEWPEKISSKNYPQLEVKSQKVYRIDEVLQSIPHQDLTLGRFTLYDQLSTFETQFEVHITSKTSDSTQGAWLRLETVSPFNCYSWDNVDISTGKTQGEYTHTVFKFNLHWIRHKGDQMQIYVNNPNDVTLDIKEFYIVAHELIRKD